MDHYRACGAPAAPRAARSTRTLDIMMSRFARVLLVIELIVCFAPATILLLLGAMIIPIGIVAAAFRGVFLAQYFLSVALIVAGVLGMVGLLALASLIGLGTPTRISNRAILALALTGAAALMPMVVSDSQWWRLIGVLPILASLHLIYLARGQLFPLWPESRTSLDDV